MQKIVGQTADHSLHAQPIVLDAISHAYGGALAVDGVSMAVEGGELLALLGPSGCGKTTLLRIIAGFIAQTRGRVVVGGRVLDRVPPNLREIGIVFQNYALFPHMTVAQNIAYGLAARGESRTVQQDRVAEMLSVVQMSHLADRKPRELSGGQQQRVAIARALAVRPKVLLLDEPFAALDKNLRLDMQIEIKRLQRQFALTSILVTHDQDEAMSIADRIAVMSRGRVEQLADPVTVYDRPSTLFVNNFIGTSNLLPGVVEGASGAERRVRLDAGATWVLRPRTAVPVGARVLVSVRPEQLVVHAAQAGAACDEGAFAAEVVLGMPIAGAVIHELRMADGRAVKVSGVRQGAEALAPGARARCALAAHAEPNVFPETS
jgi:putative spermidine/putrescine transport system ATP-binding protein